MVVTPPSSKSNWIDWLTPTILTKTVARDDSPNKSVTWYWNESIPVSPTAKLSKAPLGLYVKDPSVLAITKAPEAKGISVSVPMSVPSTPVKLIEKPSGSESAPAAFVRTLILVGKISFVIRLSSTAVGAWLSLTSIVVVANALPMAAPIEFDNCNSKFSVCSKIGSSTIGISINRLGLTLIP